MWQVHNMILDLVRGHRMLVCERSILLVNLLFVLGGLVTAHESILVLGVLL